MEALPDRIGLNESIWELMFFIDTDAESQTEYKFYNAKYFIWSNLHQITLSYLMMSYYWTYAHRKKGLLSKIVTNR